MEKQNLVIKTKKKIALMAEKESNFFGDGKKKILNIRFMNCSENFWLNFKYSEDF